MALLRKTMSSNTLSCRCNNLIIIFFNFYFRTFSQNGRGWGEGERERKKHQCERNIDQLPPVQAPIEDPTHSQGTLCPDLEPNPQLSDAWGNAPTNWATGPGLIMFLNKFLIQSSFRLEEKLWRLLRELSHDSHLMVFRIINVLYDVFVAITEPILIHYN